MSYKSAIKSLWMGTMTVTVKEKTKNVDTGVTEFSEVVTVSDEPCRISFSSISAGSITDGKQDVTQSVKLFCGMDVDVPAGSKITVTQNGITADYVSSGIPAVYTVHQEIPIEPVERWA